MVRGTGRSSQSFSLQLTEWTVSVAQREVVCHWYRRIHHWTLGLIVNLVNNVGFLTYGTVMCRCAAYDIQKRGRLHDLLWGPQSSETVKFTMGIGKNFWRSVYWRRGLDSGCGGQGDQPQIFVHASQRVSHWHRNFGDSRVKSLMGNIFNGLQEMERRHWRSEEGSDQFLT